MRTNRTRRRAIELVVAIALGAGLVALAPDPASAAPGALTLSPSGGSNSGLVNVRICASGIVDGAQVTLERPVEGAPIAADENNYMAFDTNCLLSGGSSIRATFDLTGHAPGQWTLVLANPDGTTSAAAFDVVGSTPSFAATPVTPSTVNLGTTVDVTIHGSALYRGIAVSIADGDADAGNDIVVESRTWVDTSTVVARLRVPDTAPFGLVDVVVTNTDGKDRTCADCLLVDDVNRRFIDAVYAQLLGRAPDPAGRAYWLAQLRAGRPRTDTAGALLASDEFRGRIVQELFRSILGRSADGAGLAHWIGVLRDGHLYANIQASLLGSQEFLNNVGGSRSRFLDAAYVYTLGRLPDQQGRLYWNQQMDRGLPRADVALVLATSGEARVRLVDAYYRTFLRRPADGPGVSYWALSMVINHVREETVIAALVGGEEFKALNG